MSNKILTTFIASILYATASLAGNTIFIEQNDGTLAKFLFDSEAEMTYSGSNLVITSERNQVFYKLQDLKKATFHIETSIGDTPTKEITFRFQNNTIIIERARPHALLQVYSIEGRQIGVWRTNPNGSLQVDMANFKENIYIIKLEDITYKFAKK